MSAEPRPRAWREPFEVGEVPGVIGMVLCHYSVWDGLVFIVGTRRIKPRGFRRRVVLPARPRNIEARLTGGLLLSGGEKLLVDGRAYPTGPPAPLSLRVLTMLPVLALLLAKPMWGFPAAWLAVHTNIAVIRSPLSQRVKAALVIAATGTAVAVNLALASRVGPLSFDS